MGGPSFPRFSPDFIDRVRKSVNLIEVVGEHVVLRKSGANHTGLCPFHSERSPSFGVSESKQLYHCHGCKKGGDLFSFVQEIHGLSFAEAVEELAERARIALPATGRRPGEGAESPQEQARREAARTKSQTASKLNRFVAAYYRQTLKSHSVAQEYFSSRGVEGELAEIFYVGYATAAWDGLAAHLVSRKAPLDLAQELGLIRKSPAEQAGRGVGYFDLFRNRAMFPILDLRGKVAGFGGRLLPELQEGAGDAGERKFKDPKYMNSPESLLFQKSKLAFGLFQAQKHVRELDQLILVEGYFDVLALHAAGFKNAVATCGTALTPEHLRLFRKFCSKVIVLFDGDEAGIAATDRAMEVGLEQGMVLYGASLPRGLDPDELLAEPQGRDEMKAILEGAQPLLDARIEAAVGVALSGGNEDRARELKRISAWLSKFTDPVGREIRLDDVSKKLRISKALLMPGGRERGNPPGAARAASGGAAPRPPLRLGGRDRERPILSSPEKVVLSGFIQSQNFIQEFQPLVSKMPRGSTLADIFDHPGVRNWLRTLEQKAGSSHEIAWEKELSPEVELDAQVLAIVREALFAPPSESTEEMFRDAFKRQLPRVWARFSHQVKQALEAAEAKKDARLHARLMEEYLDVRRKIEEFHQLYGEV